PRGTRSVPVVPRLALVAARLLVLGGAVRDHHYLPVAAFADAHGRDALDIAQRDVHRAPVPRAHRLECDGPPRLPRPLRGSFRDAREQVRALVGAPLDLDHDSLRLVAPDSHRDLVREELDRVHRAPVAPRQPGRPGPAQLHDDHVLVVARLPDLEWAESHPLDQALHEAPDLPELAARRPDRRPDGLGGRAPLRAPALTPAIPVAPAPAATPPAPLVAPTPPALPLAAAAPAPPRLALPAALPATAAALAAAGAGAGARMPRRPPVHHQRDARSQARGLRGIHLGDRELVL